MTSSDTSPPRRRRFASPGFVSGAIVLIAAALGLDPALAALAEHYRKEPIDLQRPLEELVREELPSFRRLPTSVLGFLPVVDDDVGTEDSALVVYGPRDRDRPLVDDPATNTVLFVTYYSDPRYQVSHTPEVCFRQGGTVVHAIHDVTVPTPSLAPDVPEIGARLLDLTLPTDMRLAVMYTLCCNGRFYTDRERVRFRMGWPGARHAYVSKVELRAYIPPGHDFDAAVRRLEVMMEEALPVLIERYYPPDEALR